MKYLLIFFLLATVACGNNEVPPSLNGKWYVNDPQGIVTGWFEIKGQMVVAGQITTTLNGNTFDVLEPREFAPDKILIYNEIYNEMIVFQDYVPNSNFTQISVRLMRVRDLWTGAYVDYTNVLLER